MVNIKTVVVVYLLLSFVAVTMLISYTPAQIIVDPQMIKENISLENQTIKTLSIKNVGRDLTRIQLEVLDSFNESASAISLEPNEITKLNHGDSKLVRVKINTSGLIDKGEYRYFLNISIEKQIKILIPIIINVESK